MLKIDREQAINFKTASFNKASLLSSYSNFQWAKFTDIAQIEALSPLQARQVLKAQAADLNVKGQAKKIIRRWQTPGDNPTPLVAPTNVTKANIFLSNGGSWKDLPLAWKEEFKETYLKNNYITGNKQIKDIYGNLPDSPEWLK
jgi:hypothetical protein